MFRFDVLRKFSTPLQILHAGRHSGGMHKNALFKGRSTLVAMVTTAAFRGLGPHFHTKTSQKRVKEKNNLLVCSHSLSGKIECIKVKTNDVTI